MDRLEIGVDYAAQNFMYAFVQGATNGTAGLSSATRTITFTNPVTQGDFVCVIIGIWEPTVGATPPTDNLGNTWHAATSQNSGAITIYYYYCYAKSTGVMTVSVVPTAACYMSVCGLEYTDRIQVNPVDGTAAVVNTNSANANAGALTVSGKNELVLATFCQGSSTQTTVGMAGYTKRMDNTNGTNGCAMTVLEGNPISTNQTVTLTYAATVFWVTLSASFKP